MPLVRRCWVILSGKSISQQLTVDAKKYLFLKSSRASSDVPIKYIWSLKISGFVQLFGILLVVWLRLPFFQETNNDDPSPEGQGTLVTSEYHVVYSSSYGVPVLYFNVCLSNGKPLSLSQIWQCIPDDAYKTKLRTDPWSVVTQSEHPYTGRPYHIVHPCNTSDFMMKCLSRRTRESSNYVATWLSCVAPMVALRLPNAYASICCSPSDSTSANWSKKFPIVWCLNFIDGCCLINKTRTTKKVSYYGHVHWTKG